MSTRSKVGGFAWPFVPSCRSSACLFPFDVRLNSASDFTRLVDSPLWGLIKGVRPDSVLNLFAGCGGIRGWIIKGTCIVSCATTL